MRFIDVTPATEVKFTVLLKEEESRNIMSASIKLFVLKLIGWLNLVALENIPSTFTALPVLKLTGWLKLEAFPNTYFMSRALLMLLMLKLTG